MKNFQSSKIKIKKKIIKIENWTKVVKLSLAKIKNLKIGQRLKITKIENHKNWKFEIFLFFTPKIISFVFNISKIVPLKRLAFWPLKRDHCSARTWLNYHRWLRTKIVKIRLVNLFDSGTILPLEQRLRLWLEIGRSVFDLVDVIDSVIEFDSLL